MKEVEQKSFLEAINLDYWQIEDKQMEINIEERLKQAIADHSLDNELIKLLPKEFYEKQGYKKVKYLNIDTSGSECVAEASNIIVEAVQKQPIYVEDK